MEDAQVSVVVLRIWGVASRVQAGEPQHGEHPGGRVERGKQEGREAKKRGETDEDEGAAVGGVPQEATWGHARAFCHRTGRDVCHPSVI